MASDLGMLVERFLAGAAGADELVAVGGQVGRRYAGRLVEPAAVDDVVQESLIEMLGTVGRLRQPGAAETWLWLIVRKQAERHRRRHRLPFPLDLAAELPATVEGPELAFLRTEQEAVVRRALQAAPDPDRRLLVLRYAGDWTDTELAELLGVSPGAVRKRLHDARRRLQPALEHLMTPSPEEARMYRPPVVEPGTIVKPGDIDGHLAPPLRQAPAEQLPTGMRAIDVFAPIRKGGSVDFLGPVGTGHLVVICEMTCNLATEGPTAVVAVASSARHPDGSSSRLQGLIEPEEVRDLCLVVDATDDPNGAVRAAGNHAARLAGEGATVLLCVDRVTCAGLTPEILGGLGGVAEHGSVTVFRVAPHARDAEAERPWPLDTTITLSLERMSAGVLPAVDVLASRSSLVDNGDLGPEAARTATMVRSVLAAASRVDRLLTQPLHVAEAYTGTQGQTVDPAQARSELESAIEGG